MAVPPPLLTWLWLGSAYLMVETAKRGFPEGLGSFPWEQTKCLFHFCFGSEEACFQSHHHLPYWNPKPKPITCPGAFFICPSLQSHWEASFSLSPPLQTESASAVPLAAEAQPSRVSKWSTSSLLLSLSSQAYLFGSGWAIWNMVPRGSSQASDLSS
jgi:hypothetical protein